ncbi:hypothetical protein EMCRGX_G016615 [Ephydatia muelleri]
MSGSDALWDPHPCSHLQSLHQRTQLHHLWSSTTHLVHKLAGVGEGTCNFCKLFNLTFLHCYLFSDLKQMILYSRELRNDQECSRRYYYVLAMITVFVHVQLYD